MRMHDLLSRLKYASTAVATLAATGATAAAAAEPVVGKGGFGETATFGQLAEFQLTGLMVVFVVLGSLTILSYLIAWILKTVAPDQYHGKPKAAHPPVATKTPPAAKPAAAVAQAVPAVAAAPATIHPGLSDEQLMAILSVAATEALGQGVAVVSFRPLGSMDWTWSIQGRVQHHTSHTL